MRRMNFGIKLKHLRMEAHLTQRELAAKVEMDAAYLSRIERGRMPFSPNIETITKFVRAMELPAAKADELFIAAGRIPPDVHEGIMSHPDVLTKVRRILEKAA